MTSGACIRSVRHHQRREHDYYPGWQRVRDDHWQPAAVRVCCGWSAGHSNWRFQEGQARFPLIPRRGGTGYPVPPLFLC